MLGIRVRYFDGFTCYELMEKSKKKLFNHQFTKVHLVPLGGTSKVILIIWNLLGVWSIIKTKKA